MKITGAWFSPIITQGLDVFIRHCYGTNQPGIGLRLRPIFQQDAPVAGNTSAESKNKLNPELRGTMNWIIFGLVLIWLGMISWFDLRDKEIPSSLWVIIPLISAGAYRYWNGGGALVALTLMVALISERERIASFFRFEPIGFLCACLPILFLCAYINIQHAPFPTFSILAFWLAWELKWWGGADASASLALVLIFPEIAFLLGFLGVHLLVGLGLSAQEFINKKSLTFHTVPGLPLLFASIVFLPMLRMLVKA